MPTYHPKVQLTQQLLQRSENGREITVSFEEMQSVAMPLLKMIISCFPEVFIPDAVGGYNSIGFYSGDGRLFISCQIRDGLPMLELDVNDPTFDPLNKKNRIITGLLSAMQIVMVAFYVERYKKEDRETTKEKILRELLPIISNIIDDVQMALAPNT